MKLVCPPEASEVQKLHLRISVISTGDCIVLLFLLEDKQASFDFLTSCETPYTKLILFAENEIAKDVRFQPTHHCTAPNQNKHVESLANLHLIQA